jgi:hypothetical protein
VFVEIVSGADVRFHRFWTGHPSTVMGGRRCWNRRPAGDRLGWADHSVGRRTVSGPSGAARCRCGHGPNRRVRHSRLMDFRPGLRHGRRDRERCRKLWDRRRVDCRRSRPLLFLHRGKACGRPGRRAWHLKVGRDARDRAAHRARPENRDVSRQDASCQARCPVWRGWLGGGRQPAAGAPSWRHRGRPGRLRFFLPWQTGSLARCRTALPSALCRTGLAWVYRRRARPLSA